MANENGDMFQIVLPDNRKADFLRALTAAANAESVAAPTFDEAIVPEGAARALNFDPITLSVGSIAALKFIGSAIAGHIICKTFDAWLLGPLSKTRIVVVDPQGRRYEVKAESLSSLRALFDKLA